MARGIVLFAHGSRDPLWRRPVEAVAQAIAERDASLCVACAYLELTLPDLATAVAAMVATGVTSMTVVPMFLGVGRHAREDLPKLVDELRLAYPALVIELQPAVSEHPLLIQLLADIALQ